MMVPSRCRLFVFLPLLPLCSLAAGAAGVEQVTLRSGAAEGALPTASGKVVVTSLAPAAGLDYLSTSKISWSEEVAVVARVYRSVKGNGSTTAELCATLPVDSKTVAINPSTVVCLDRANGGRGIYEGGWLVIEFADTNHLVLKIPNWGGLLFGSDVGIGLTLVNRRNDDDAFSVQDGLSAYYSISKLKTSSVRGIANVSILDFDEEKDFELGLGLGLMVRTNGWDSDPKNGLGLVFGVGYNLMVKESSDALYTFVGLSWNIDRSSN